MADKIRRSDEEEEESNSEAEEGEEAAEAVADTAARTVMEKRVEENEQETEVVASSPTQPSNYQAAGSPENKSKEAAPPLVPSCSVPTPVISPSAPGISPGINLFANDGSFLELFKKKMEATSAGSSDTTESREAEEKTAEAEKRKPVSFVGKRRGGARLALKTGMVAKKPKTDEEEVKTNKGGAWAQYMAEVKKYKAHQCSDDDKTRPLVK
ncbi:telomerase RNA component interacting RNase [Bombina bombina]|uniref:telomerase RNA component interacting RNase n=1 Tax=Bombina bombina TaxID=8345 RepID=UPI00235B0711|nr:telomerase RNA component interacting RNase [Bombina bombina]